MSKTIGSAALALVLLVSGTGGAISLAKPPDLPVDLRVEFDNEEPPPNTVTLGVDLFTGKLSLSFTVPWDWLPWKGMTSDARPNAACPPRETAARETQTVTTPKQAQARAMFAIAERCLRNGDLDKARTCYEETHLLAPETRFGRQAIERLAEIDSARSGSVGEGTAEEQEPRERKRR
jgi:hypothetical protein